MLSVIAACRSTGVEGRGCGGFVRLVCLATLCLVTFSGLSCLECTCVLGRLMFVRRDMTKGKIKARQRQRQSYSGKGKDCLLLVLRQGKTRDKARLETRDKTRDMERQDKTTKTREGKK